MTALWILGGCVAVVAIISLWIYLMGVLWQSWEAVAQGFARLDPNVRAAVGWRQPIAAGANWQSILWQRQRMQTRVLLYGLPRTEDLKPELRKAASRFRRLILLFMVPCLIPVLITGLLAVEFLLLPIGVLAIFALGAGRWPRRAECETRTRL